MSIVIKGMDMPTSCSRCPCSNDASRFCRVVEEYIPMLGKPAFCPLVDVPDTNVGDMISRQAAIHALNKYITLGREEQEQQARDIEIIQILPSAQPVIRCKDCKHFGGGTYCHERDGMWDENDFCSYAERKEQDDG